MKRRWLIRVAAATAVVALLLSVWVFLRPGIAVAAWREAEHLRAGADTGSLEIEGRKLAWARVGAGAKRPVLLVHGLRGETAVMLPLARALARRGHAVTCIDLPGHGRSEPSRGEFGIARAAGVVTQAMEGLSFPSPPLAVGHSMGGWIVALAALDRPELFGGVALVASAGLRFEPPPYPLLMPHTAAEARESLPLLFADPPMAPTPVLWFAARRPSAASLDLLRSATGGRFLLDGLLGGLVPPAVVIWGESDRLIPPELGRRLAREIPGAGFELIPGTGHMLVWEDPEAVAEAIDTFDRSLAVGGGGR